MTLTKAAYGKGVDLTRSLQIIADALNGGDVGRAMIAALRLPLPPLNAGAASHLAKAHDLLGKANFNPNEPRDERGRWTTSGPGSSAAPTQNGRDTDSSQPSIQPTLVANLRGANDNFSDRVCRAAGKQCEITALNDTTGRRAYFSSCQESEDVCVAMLTASRRDPERLIGVAFPDRTVVLIEDGNAMLTHVGGVRLTQPLS